MIRLNLIPEKIREENRLKHVYRLNFRLVLIIFYFSLVTISISLIAKVVLTKTNIETSNQLEFISQNTKAYNSKIGDLNNQIEAIGAVLVNNYEWNNIITNLYNLVPDGVKIINLKLDQAGQSLVMSVTASSRDDLLLFKEAMNKSNLITPIELPMSVILQKENIEFTFTTRFDFAAGSNNRKAK